MTRPTSEQRKSVRFYARLRIRYSLHDKTEKTTIYHGAQRQNGDMPISSDVEHQKTDDIKEGLTIDISTHGVLFETADKPDLGKVCQLEILLPQEDSITALGKITKVDEAASEKGKIYKVIVEFTLITEANIGKICMSYYKNRLISDFEHTPERRKSKRFKVKKARLSYRRRQFLTWTDWKVSPIADVTPTGILFKTQEDFKVNEILLVEMYFPAYDKPINALGKVIRIRRNRLELVNEIALHLSKLREEDKNKLEEPNYLNALVEKADNTLTWF